MEVAYQVLAADGIDASLQHLIEDIDHRAIEGRRRPCPDARAGSRSCFSYFRLTVSRF